MAKTILLNWKTSASGLGTLLIAVGDIMAHGWQANWQVDIPAIAAGIGLLAAKDHNVSGTGK